MYCDVLRDGKILDLNTFLSFIQTHNLHRSDTPHQLLQQSDVTVRKLADALSDKLLLVHGEAVALPTLQQTAGHKSGRSHILGKLL